MIAIGEGLRAMHDALPVADCPFSWMAQGRIAAAERAAASERRETSDWAPEHRELGIEGALPLGSAFGGRRLVAAAGRPVAGADRDHPLVAAIYGIISAFAPLRYAWTPAALVPAAALVVTGVGYSLIIGGMTLV